MTETIPELDKIDIPTFLCRKKKCLKLVPQYSNALLLARPPCIQAHAPVILSETHQDQFIEHK